MAWANHGVLKSFSIPFGGHNCNCAVSVIKCDRRSDNSEPFLLFVHVISLKSGATSTLMKSKCVAAVATITSLILKGLYFYVMLSAEYQSGLLPTAPGDRANVPTFLFFFSFSFSISFSLFICDSLFTKGEN